ncbi:alanine dehydrogenase [Candidatus Finniella inopinata]|uniref:Alanine dehydrogenase n=1 Tax=Candidatus Finniella inopinata TaxID=1696036 RepID=A0A4Q7DL41_9PROT|nr:alanine dehydrogenase [Candidatus Finniella inopinata]RZI47128.1 alanine dehydrogenase [Candidatus Finniella inopinata]
MIIGVPKEIKNHEYRVGLTPASAQELLSNGHKVLVETQAGTGIGFGDHDYQKVGATIVQTAAEIFNQADMIIKVKEPQLSECKMLRPDQVLFTYLHLAPDLEQTKGLMESGCIAIAYETVTDSRGGLPLLAPMSEVAGRMSIQVGAYMLEKGQGGAGVLLGGVAGVEPGRVLVLGGGVVGANAARIAMGMGAEVTIVDRNPRRLNELDWEFSGRIKTIFSTRSSVEKLVSKSDLVIGAVLVVGAAAPRLVTRDMLKKMRPGSVLVDVAIDQGGCFETSRPTTHAEPSYVVDDIVHYCVTNMPGAVARTSTMALNNATLPFALALAQKGYRQALSEDPHLLNGLNVYKGKVTYQAVAEALDLDYTEPSQLLAA